MLQIKKFIEQYFNIDITFYKRVKINQHSFLTYVNYDCEDCENATVRLYFSDKLGDCLNRVRGFDLNKSANNGICLYNWDIDKYFWIDYNNIKEVK